MTNPVLDLKAVEARLKAATPGPWETGTLEVWVRQTATVRQLIASLVEGPSQFNYPEKGFEHNDSGHNTEFIAHAPDDIEALLALLRQGRMVVTMLLLPAREAAIQPARDWLAKARDE